ncbi:MAG: amidase [Pseudomonadota bacterium]
MLDRIAAHDGRLNAFITVTGDAALAAASRADADFARGVDRGVLQGIPLAIKDLCDTQGVRTTGGSKVFEHRVPETDATVVRRLKAAGAVILGKTGLHELAYGTTSENDWFGAVRNPWLDTHFAGGSSGGSAAAVAAGLAFGAIGTDTGCSIRQPSHCCGVTGFKPTFGLVSKAGVIPLCWTMDHVGPITRTVEDTALMLDVIAGPDASDPYCLPAPERQPFNSAGGNLKHLRIGIVERYFFDGDDEVVDIVRAALAQLFSAGAQAVSLDLPDVADAALASRDIFAEAAAIHERDLQQCPEHFGEQVRGKLLAAQRITSAAYARAQHFRRGFTQRADALFAHCDVLAAPTSTAAAVAIDNPPANHAQLAWQNTIISDFTGQPSISIPCGFTAAGLPVGLMLTGALTRDATVLQAARLAEAALRVNRPPPC